MNQHEISNIAILAKECLMATAEIRKLVEKKGLTKQQASEKVLPAVSHSKHSMSLIKEPSKVSKAICMISDAGTMFHLPSVSCSRIASYSKLSETSVKKLYHILKYGDRDTILNVSKKTETISKAYTRVRALEQKQKNNGNNIKGLKRKHISNREIIVIPMEE